MFLPRSDFILKDRQVMLFSVAVVQVIRPKPNQILSFSEVVLEVMKFGKSQTSFSVNCDLLDIKLDGNRIMFRIPLYSLLLIMVPYYLFY